MTTTRAKFERRRMAPALRQAAIHLRSYLTRHPEVSWEQFLEDAVEHEIASRAAPASAREAPPPRAQTGALVEPPTRDDVQSVSWLDQQLDDYYASKSGLLDKLRTVFGRR